LRSSALPRNLAMKMRQSMPGICKAVTIRSARQRLICSSHAAVIPPPPQDTWGSQLEEMPTRKRRMVGESSIIKGGVVRQHGDV